MMRWLPHFHRDPDWRMTENGIFALHECRCGAKRTRWVNHLAYRPVPAGFPLPRDKHGQYRTDSGWVMPEGWSAS